jgi:acetylornithine/LysW-gamma-L-lysine aminotransferase
MANVYHKRDIVIVRGKGVFVWDANGKQYLDCMAGYGTCLIGHSNERIIEAVKSQVEKLQACHGSTYNDARAEFIAKLVSITPKGLSKVFLCNSGAESVESAIKIARKFTGKKEIIAMMRSFHGKTMGALSATWDMKYRAPFEPLLPKIKFVPFGKIERVKETITEDTAAIIVEPVQGEGGVYVAPDDYLQELREISEKNDLLLIFDEVQTGFGRTGKMFAFEHWNVVPDILCLAKGGGSGLPIGVTVSRKEIMDSLKVGEHSSTFGGNPISCAAASATIDVIVEWKLWEKAALTGNYFKRRLGEVAERCKIVREIRGLGLMIGTELRLDVLSIMQEMLDKGVIVLNAGVNVLRFLPPLIIEKEQVDMVIEKLEPCLVKKWSEHGLD